ncbi:MAG: hypothetical protein EXS16_17980, partial [Gemmataceae bacterium]|nr:hypothetical protein [Gemmataceae bacterium]
MWYANEADAQADQNLHAWFDLARDEVEGIRLCRDKPETNDWTTAAPRRGPIPLRCMPEKHTAAITTVAGWMLHH